MVCFPVGTISSIRHVSNALCLFLAHTHLITRRAKESEKAGTVVPYLLQIGEDPNLPPNAVLNFSTAAPNGNLSGNKNKNNDQATNALQSVDNYL